MDRWADDGTAFTSIRKDGFDFALDRRPLGFLGGSSGRFSSMGSESAVTKIFSSFSASGWLDGWVGAEGLPHRGNNRVDFGC